MLRPKRPNGISRAYASVSVVAILGLMVGCSQPSSYATVDLGGSYADNAPQVYNPQSGLPVYQSTQVYTTPYGVGSTQPQAQPQLVYRDAPQNQVASLAPIQGNSYARPVQQSFPTFGVAEQAQILTDETILRSDGFVDVGAYEGFQTATLAPGAGSIGFDQFPVVSDVPKYLPTPQSFPQSLPLAAPTPFVEPVIAEVAPQAPPIAMIETGELPELSQFSVAPVVAQPPAVAVDSYTSNYTNFVTEAYSPVADIAVPQNAPLAPLIEATPLDLLQSGPEAFAGLSQLPARNDPQGVADYYDLRGPDSGQSIPEAGFAAIAPAPQTTAQVYNAPNGRGITLPQASTEYQRPYEALPPGFFPTYEFPSIGNSFSEVAPVAQNPQFSAFEPDPALVQPFALPVAFDAAEINSLDQASTRVFGGLDHTIRPGDTLYSISRLYSVTPEAIAGANGLELSGTIYPGNVISIPADEMTSGPETLGDAPIVVLQTAEAASSSTYTTDLTHQSADTIDVAELARLFRARQNNQAGAGIPIISAEAGVALRGHPDLRPTEVITEPQGSLVAPAVALTSIPTPVAVTRGSYSWPIHGEVYRLSQGEIEIDAPVGQSVVAAAAGRVVAVQNGPRGYLVVVEHNDGWRSLTLGISNVVVQPGQEVSEGATLGQSGGQRIRFELRDSASNVAETLGILRS